MDVSVTALTTYFTAVLVGSLIFNFLSIHPMANLVLYEGSSRSKSFSLSAQFALLTSTLVTAFLVLPNLTGLEIASVSKMMLYGIIGASSASIELIRVWYTKTVYETNYLYAFIIAEGVMIFLYLLLLVLSNTFFGLF